MKTTNTLGSGIAPLKFISRAFVAIVLVVLFLVSPPKIFAAKTKLSVGDNHTYGELNLKFISSTHEVEFHSGVGTTGAVKTTDINGISGVEQRWDVTHRVDIGGGSHAHPEVLRFAYSFNSYGVLVNPGSPSNYVLMYRTFGSSPGTSWTNAGSSATVVNNDTVVFILNIMCGYDLEFAIATLDTTQSPLPVTWIRFGAKTEGFTNVVTWTTATENNNDRFEIERTVDGKIFTTIGTVKGASNSNQNIYYKFIDNMPVKDCFYRLKQIDFDGKFDYSALIVPRETDLGKVPEISLYPNPASNEDVIMISLKKLAPKSYLVVTDAYGKVVFQTNFEDSEVLLALPNLATGYYIVTVFNTKNILNRKITVINED
jgi:hypothetical protein